LGAMPAEWCAMPEALAGSATRRGFTAFTAARSGFSATR